MPAASSNSVALVTGAGGGLGGGIARALAAAGFNLVLNDLAETPALGQLRDELRPSGVAVDIAVEDIARVEQLDRFVRQVNDLHGRLDCLVNNAGVSVLSRGDILDVSPESFDRCIDVNLRAQFFLTQSVAKCMLANPRPATRRSIVTVSTVAVEQVIGKVIAEYAIAKSGLPMMVKQFAVRLAGEGIDCYEVRPGMMATNMTESSHAKYDALIASGFVPANRWGEPADVGRAVAALASGAFSYTVGQTIHVDGGMPLKVF